MKYHSTFFKVSLELGLAVAVLFVSPSNLHARGMERMGGERMGTERVGTERNTGVSGENMNRSVGAYNQNREGDLGNRGLENTGLENRGLENRGMENRALENRGLEAGALEGAYYNGAVNSANPNIYINANPGAVPVPANTPPGSIVPMGDFLMPL